MKFFLKFLSDLFAEENDEWKFAAFLKSSNKKFSQAEFHNFGVEKWLLFGR